MLDKRVLQVQTDARQTDATITSQSVSARCLSSTLLELLMGLQTSVLLVASPYSRVIMTDSAQFKPPEAPGVLIYGRFWEEIAGSLT